MIERFTPGDAAALASFLSDPARPAGTLSQRELKGFLFALAGAPELVEPAEWLPAIFDGQDPEYASLDEAQAVVGQTLRLYNEINEGVLAGHPVLPADCALREVPAANLEEDAPVAGWARGFQCGHRWLEEIWEAYLPEELDEEMGAILLTLSFFSSRSLAEAFVAETAKAGTTVESMAVTLSRIFHDAMTEYARIGRVIYEVRVRSAAEDGPAGGGNPGPVLPRNDPCPCGSGRKYEKCCGAARR